MKLFLWAAGGALALLLVALGGWTLLMRTVETPDHRVIRAEGAYELRAYPALRVAEIARDGPRRAALREGFGPLARYIFARDREGPKIAMTAPVTQRPSGEGWAVAFILPAEYADAAPPAPATPGVAIRTEPAGRWAALRFSETPDDASLAAREAALRGWIAAQELSAQGAAVYAYYDDPMVPGFLRRNEVLIRVAGPETPA